MKYNKNGIDSKECFFGLNQGPPDEGGKKCGAIRGDMRRIVDRYMAGISSSFYDHTSKPSTSTIVEPTASGEVLDVVSPCDPGNIHLPHDHTGISSFGRFWANKDDQADEDDKEEEITTPTKEEFIAAAAHAGYHLQDLILAENEIATVEKVSFSSSSSTEFRCPLSSKIIKAMVR
jgi:hypothetical protein